MKKDLRAEKRKRGQQGIITPERPEKGLLSERLAMPDALDETQVDEQVNQRVAVGDGALVTGFRSLNAQAVALGIEAFGSGALFVDEFEEFRVSVELVSDASAISQGQIGQTAPFGSAFVVDRTGLDGSCERNASYVLLRFT